MKTIEFKGEKYKVPTSWSEITLEKQIQVSNDQTEFKNDITKKLSLISAYAEIPIDIIKHSTPAEAGKLFQHMKFLKNDIPDKQIAEFTFKGDKYYVAQNLLDSEFQDYLSMEIAIQNNEGKIYNALPQMIAVLCKKQKEDGELETLDDYDVNERAEMFKQLPISIANGLAVFFYQSEKISKIRSLLYSNKNQIILKKAEEVENTLKKQGGKGLLSRLLIGILLSYIRYIKRIAQKSSNSTQSKSFTHKWKMICRKFAIKNLSINKKQKNKK